MRWEREELSKRISITRANFVLTELFSRESDIMGFGKIDKKIGVRKKKTHRLKIGQFLILILKLLLYTITANGN